MRNRTGSSHVLTADGLDHIIRWGTEKFCDDGKLVDMVLPWKQRFPFKHLRKNAPCTPDIHFHIIFLPREHDFGSAVISCRHVACHLRVLNTGQTEIADFQITVLIYQDIAGFEVAVHYACGVDVF